MHCCLIATLIRIFFKILNVILSILFILMALFGILMKFQPNIVAKALEMVTGFVESEKLIKIAKFIMETGQPLSTIFIVVGAIGFLMCLIGLLSVGRGWKCLFIVYIVLLCVLSLAQLLGVGLLFADQGIRDKFMNKTMEEYGNNTLLGDGATVIWDMLTTSDNKLCCGMRGYMDFINATRLPPACCMKVTLSENGKFSFREETGQNPDNTETTECKLANANAEIVGCSDKVDKFFNLENMFSMGIIGGLVGIQIVTAILSGIGLCTGLLGKK